MRCFLAFDVPLTLRRELDRRLRSVRGKLPKARWVRPEAMHLTLVFLGEQEPGRLTALHAALEPVFAAGSSLRMRLAEPGVFPPRGKARTLWLGIEADGDLAGLQRAVASASVEAVGLEPERRAYHPHLTLARMRPPWPVQALGNLRLDLDDTLGEPFEVDRGVLYESTLHPDGARYREVRTYPLAPRESAPGAPPR